MPTTRSSARPAAVAALIATMLSALWSGPGSPAVAQVDEAPVELAAVILTTAELEAAGLEGYGSALASPWNLEIASAYLGNTEDVRSREAEDGLEEAGFVRGYSLTSERRDADGDVSEAPEGQVKTTAYLFDDEGGAAAAFDLISGGGAGDGAVRGLGDDSAFTTIEVADDVEYDVVSVVYQLEFLVGPMVLEVSTAIYGQAAVDDRTEADDEAATELLTELADPLEERAAAALDGETPGLEALLVEVEGGVDDTPFRVYDLIDGEGIRVDGESDEGYADGVEAQLDRGTVSVIRNQTFLTEATNDLAEYRLYNTVRRFEDEATAEAYLAELVDRLRGLEGNVGVEVVGEDLGMGDESLAIEIGREEEDGDVYQRLELFVRVGDTVGLIFVDQSALITAGPELSLEALTPLGEAQAACFEDGACDGRVPLPDEIAELIETAAT